MGWLFLSAKRRKFEEAIDTLSWSTLDICLQSNVSDCQTWWLTAAVFSLVIFSLGLGCYGVGPLDSCVKRNLVLWCSYERTQNNCAKKVEKVHLWKCKHIWQNENFLFSKTLYVLNTEGCLSQGRKRCYRGMQNLYQCERSFLPPDNV